MKTVLLYHGLLLGLFLIVASMALWAQTPVSVKIYATDEVGQDSVIIGVHPLATNGIDTSLGEREIPPPPPTFDFRCVSISGTDTLLGGSLKNLHRLVRDTQTDRYRL